MEYWAYISFVFLVFQLANVLINFTFRQTIKRTDTLSEELISVLIPARNEEENIGVLLEGLSKIKNQNIEILVFDDQSTDNTAKLVQEHSLFDTRIKLFQSEGLPIGWLGKNHACYQLAKKANGTYYLFIDADLKLLGNIIIDAAAYLSKHQLGLMSIFPTQVQKTFEEKFTVPIMNYILLTLLPLIFVRISPFKAHSAANGQFMLFESKVYNKYQPHRLFKNSSVEDIAISGFLKKEKIKIACLTGEKRVECRMYKSYNEALNGFSKNVFMFFGNKPLLAFLFWMLVTLGVIPVLFAQNQHLYLYLSGMLLIQLVYSRTGKQNVFPNILFFPIQLIFLLQVMLKSMVSKKQRQFTWKGRNIYL